jgi:hypothetical protein
MQFEVFEELTLTKLYKYLDSVKISARKCAGVLRFYVEGTARPPLGRETKLHFVCSSRSILETFAFLYTLREIVLEF